MKDYALIKYSKNRLEEFRSGIDRLHALGITKDPEMGLKTSQITVTYPPTQSLIPVTDKVDVYEDVSGRNTLYVHIPFCTGICTYCGYSRSAASDGDEKVTSYQALLEKEATLLSEKFNGQKIPVESIYIGGGTPTLLSVSDLERMLQTVDRYFLLDQNGEYTLEGSPETMTSEKVKLSVSYGVNRASIGAESFNDNVLRIIHRRHNSRGVFEAVEKIRNGGIENIDIDLIRGLPSYTFDMVLDDLRGIRTLGVQSVSSYQYTVKPKTLDAKRKPELLSEEELLQMHILFVAGMDKIGYTQRPIDFYNIDKNHEFKHQLLKWSCQVNQLVLGIGCYGFISNTQFTNTTNRRKYEELINNGKLPVEKSFVLSPEELIRRDFLFGLKTEVDVQGFHRRHNANLLDTYFSKDLERLIESGAIEVSYDSIRLTELGSLFADWIQCKFYSPSIKQTTI
ncbi:hypothetical protein COU54_03405 [Candidatus Pacearchaeota archaeon CG10_big_fil_rev_8_21_14_0_10_31_24]|nr:MAG: hypothetical protein COU54_03405 [Candidatus Pacearchaeota archaeon CG10_big_fil_rev_8_21_14_0_10_31_24]